jgi:hypothetical protein
MVSLGDDGSTMNGLNTRSQMIAPQKKLLAGIVANI